MLAATLCCIGLGACRGDEATEPPVAKAGTPANSSAPTSGGHTIRYRIHPSLPEFAFSLIGDRPTESSGEFAVVKRIEIRHATAAEPFQVIDGLDIETPSTAGMPQIDLLDMNFDGYDDMRMVEFRAAGPNAPYLTWLFDPRSVRFAESRELNAIPSPRFDSDRREIHSSWRDGAMRYGADVYVHRPAAIRAAARSTAAGSAIDGHCAPSR
jgi:hypothetical protein